MKIEDFLKSNDVEQKVSHLECDGSTRVISYLLNKHGIKHVTKIGSVRFNRDHFSPHLWIELPNKKIIDYKLRMWFGNKAPNGVISQNKNLEYSGKKINLKVSEFIYQILSR